MSLTCKCRQHIISGLLRRKKAHEGLIEVFFFFISDQMLCKSLFYFFADFIFELPFATLTKIPVKYLTSVIYFKGTAGFYSLFELFIL